MTLSSRHHSDECLQLACIMLALCPHSEILMECSNRQPYTVNRHKYSSPSILRYIFHIKPHFSKKIIVKLFLNGFWSFLHQKKQKYLKIICLF